MSLRPRPTNAHEFQGTEGIYYNVKWSFATAKTFFRASWPPASPADAAVLTTPECMKSPDAAAKNLYLHMQGYGLTDDNSMDFIHSLFWYCGYFDICMAARGLTAPFPSCGEQKECRFSITLLTHRERKPIAFVLSANSIAAGVARIFAASISLYGQHHPRGKYISSILVIGKLVYFVKVPCSVKLQACVQGGRRPDTAVNVLVYTPIPKNQGLMYQRKAYDSSELQHLMDSMEAFKNCLPK